MNIDLFLFPSLIIIFIVIQGFFAMSEMAMVSSNKYKLTHLANKKDLNANIILDLLNTPEKLFATTLVGINLATVVTSSLADHFFKFVVSEYFTGESGWISVEVLTLVILEPMILLFGELVPMSIARKYPNTTAIRNARLIRVGFLIFYPLMMLISQISKFIGDLFGSKHSEFGKVSRDELKQIVCGRISGATDNTRDIISEIFDINEMTAEDIMVHLSEVTAIHENSSVRQLKDIINQTNFSRIPVYRDSIFNITSTIHIGSILGIRDDDPIENYSDKLYIIPSTKPIIQILTELKRNRKYMAIVVDEYGAVCGIITLEDILEQIVGDIEDEFDDPEFENFSQKNNGIYEGRCDLEDLLDETGINLLNPGTHTLSGLINLKLGRIGRKGDILKENDYQISVLDASDKVVKMVKIEKI